MRCLCLQLAMDDAHEDVRALACDVRDLLQLHRPGPRMDAL